MDRSVRPITWVHGGISGWLALASMAVVVAGCGLADATDEATSTGPGGVVVSEIDPDSTYRGAELATPYPMPDVTLVASDGRSFNLMRDTTRPVTVVFFGYTHCPDVCPLVMSDLTAAVLRLSARVRAQTQLLFITTDPARDDPQTLHGYLDRYSDEFLGLTGGRAEIVRAARVMGVPIGAAERLPDGGYDVSHGVQVIGFREDSAPVVWTEGTPVEDLVADITTLARP